MEQDLRETLLRSSNVENDDEKHHYELLRYSGMKDQGERHLTDDNSFLRQTWKRIETNSGKREEESGKILGKNLWVRAHSKDTPLNNLKERLHRLN